MSPLASARQAGQTEGQAGTFSSMCSAATHLTLLSVFWHQLQYVLSTTVFAGTNWPGFHWMPWASVVVVPLVYSMSCRRASKQTGRYAYISVRIFEDPYLPLPLTLYELFVARCVGGCSPFSLSASFSTTTLIVSSYCRPGSMRFFFIAFVRRIHGECTYAYTWQCRSRRRQVQGPNGSFIAPTTHRSLFVCVFYRPLLDMFFCS